MYFKKPDSARVHGEESKGEQTGRETSEKFCYKQRECIEVLESVIKEKWGRRGRVEERRRRRKVEEEEEKEQGGEEGGRWQRMVEGGGERKEERGRMKWVEQSRYEG